MTNEITIFPSGDNGHNDPVPAHMPGNAMPPAAPKSSPLQQLHRLLRGRYLLVGILALGGAAVGAAVGWSSKKPNFRSDAWVNVNPTVSSADSSNEQMVTMYNVVVNSQVQLLQSENTLAEARRSQDWQQVGANTPTNDALAFFYALDVQWLRQTYMIRVSFVDPDSKVAFAGAKSVAEAYRRIYGDAEFKERDRKIGYLQKRVDGNKAEQSAKQELINGLTKNYATSDLRQLIETQSAELLKREGMLNQQEAALTLAQANLDAQRTAPPPDLQTLIDQIAVSDPKMRDYLAQRENAETRLSELRGNYGANSQHKLVLGAQAYLDEINKKIEAYARRPIFMNPQQQQNTSPEMIDSLAASLRTKEQIEGFAKVVEKTRKDVAEAKRNLTELGQLNIQLEGLKSDVFRLSESMRSDQEQINKLRGIQELTNRIIVMPPTAPPDYPTVDKRKQFAVLGFLGGGAFPIAVVLLFGLMDRRYRYSDDANADLAHLPLLGVLPELPDRLSDPEQAAVASHCVHQIRAMLQIDGTGTTRHVWAVTSATSGDGKTSLTLSLGLSYAACGARTLLIDCDLVGAGLSHRLNIKSPQGVLDAIATRSLLQFVHSTDAADVAILPAGAATPQQASALSPAALRRLILEAKRHFEVIIIDSGPVLGSIEASLVATAVDGVILTVARGQSRGQVDKCVTHLQSIGARIAGVVFNRANQADFSSAISGQSQRMQGRTVTNGNGKGHEASPFGPVARAVATSSFKDGRES